VARTLAALLLVFAVWRPAVVQAGPFRLELTDAQTGKTLLSRALDDGEQAVLTWTNSLFGLLVTEVFVVRAGRLELDSVTFAHPAGGEPPRVRPEDLDDLYHTGGAFRAEGLSRPVRRVVFRVGEIGNPVLRVGDQVVRFLEAVGFGGAIVMEAK